jgi:transcriptional regulator with XRE-family HTH domain
VSRRWTLRSIPFFKHCMNYPGSLVPYTIRSLAEASGVKRGVIEKLLNGSQVTADVDDAVALAEAFGVAINVLFAAPASPELDSKAPSFLPAASRKLNQPSRSRHPH